MQFRNRLARIVAGSCLLPLSASALAQPGPIRAEVPIREVVLSDGTLRYTVPIKVGNTEIQAGLDSGSSGLRVLPGVLTPTDSAPTRERSSYSYGSGAELTGVVGRGTLSIGTASDSTSFELIDKIGCSERKPDCPASRIPLSAYGIQGNGLRGEGFKAILGVGMAEADVASPLRAIGAKSWIIELPLPGSRKPGRLILNPTAEETAGFAAFPVDRRFSRQPGGMHDAIPACLTNTRSGQKFCGAALLDSGAPGIDVINGSGTPWPSGAPAQVSFGDRSKPQTSADFMIGRREYSSHLGYVPEPVDDTRLHLGLMPYFAYIVLYDPAAGTVALKPRADTAMTVR